MINQDKNLKKIIQLDDDEWILSNEDAKNMPGLATNPFEIVPSNPITYSEEI